MKNKTLLVMLVALTATMLVFTGCGNKENDTVPVVSGAVEEIEATTPIKETEIVEDISEVTTEVNNDTTTTEDGIESNIGGEDTETDAEIEEQIDEAKKEEESKGTTADDIETNYGKGYDLNGKHYDTRTEYIEAFQEANLAAGAMTHDEAVEFHENFFAD